MLFGTALFVTDQSMDAAEAARETEARGLESFWVPEHTHIPTSRISPWPGGGELPERYRRTHDPFVSLTAAACATRSIKLGFGVCLLIQRDPIITAKQVASLDAVSGGRVIFGVGGGWNLEEMEDHGTDPRRRFKLLRERVEAMKAIWTQDEAEYHGELVDFGPLWSWPKPVQKPYPPILVGGNVERTLERAVRYGDGWIPNAGRSNLEEQVPRFRALCEESGRGRLPVTVFGPRLDRGEIDTLLRLDVERVVFWLPSEGRDAALQRLEDISRQLADV
jgi:probable F420-dependent oxidoreductase